MPRGKKWRLPAIGLLTLALSAALLGRPHCGGPRPGTADRQFTALSGHRFPVNALAFAPDGSTLTSAAYHPFAGPAGEVEVADWEVATATRTARRSASCQDIRCLAIAPGGRTLAAAENRAVWLWDKDAPHRRRLLTEHRYLVSAVAFSACGRLLATADSVEVAVWDVAGGRRRTCCQGGLESAVTLAFAPDGRTLAGGGRDTTVRLWDVDTGQSRGACRGHAGFVSAVAFSPFGASLASGCLGGVVKLWDVASPTDQATLATPGEEVSAVAFAPDGRTLAVAAGRAVRLWDAATGRLLGLLEGHTAKVSCLAYAPDGSRLASGSHDRTVRLWDVSRQQAPIP